MKQRPHPTHRTQIRKSEECPQGSRQKRSIEELIKFIATQKGISPELICSGSRKTIVSDARSIVAYLAVEETGHAATKVARHLGVRQTSVLQSIKKGRILYTAIGQEP